MLERMICVALLFGVTGCGSGGQKTVAQIKQKAANVKRLGELRTALGEPDDFIPGSSLDEKIWIYKASDGKVRFLVTGQITVELLED